MSTVSIVALSAATGILSGLAEWATGLLRALNENLTPATASLIGAVIVGVLSVGARELREYVKLYLGGRPGREAQ